MSTENQQDIVKQNIIQWCKDDNIPCEDVSSKNHQFAWGLAIGKPETIIYKQPHLPDRIYIQSQITITPEHQELINTTWTLQKKNDMLLNLRMLAVQYDINMNFQEDSNGKLIAISSFKIHFHSSIKKANILKMFIRVQSIHIVILNQLSKALGIEMKQLQAQQQSSDSSNPAIG